MKEETNINLTEVRGTQKDDVKTFEVAKDKKD